MSEGTDSSTPSSEPEKPEQVSAPSEGKKRKLLPMIIAIIVVAILIGTAAYFLFIPGDELKGKITPDPCVLGAGTRKTVTVQATVDGKDQNESVTYRWSVTPSSLGSFSLLGQKSVDFIAGDSEGEGTIQCHIEWNEKSYDAEADLTIEPPVFDQVVVSPSAKTLAQGASQAFTATAVDSVGGTIPDAVITWSVGGLAVGEYTLNATTGNDVLFTAGSVEGNATLNATSTIDGITKVGTADIVIGGDITRSVVYHWYDMFNCSFDDHWYKRWAVYSVEEPVTSSYPYIWRWYGFPEGNTYYYTNMRLNVTAKNLDSISMLGNPWFFPMFGTTKGGNAFLDWDLYYPTYAQINASHPSAYTWYDGWLVELKGNLTLDRQAAMAVLGVTSAEFDNFGTWWTANGATMKNAFQNWYQSQSAQTIFSSTNGRPGPLYYDIYCSYDGDLNVLAFDVNAAKVGDKVVLSLDSVSWGMEVLVTKWLRYAFMGNEWYFEDFHMQAWIGPERTDLNLTTVAVYSVYAYETTLPPSGWTHGSPCWVWEGLLQDYIISKPPKHPYSDYDAYKTLNYSVAAPGNPYYGTNMTYDYAPGVQNLTWNDTLIFEWASGSVPFYVDVGGGVGIAEQQGEMTLEYAEPLWPSDLPENLTAVVDETNRTLTYTAATGDVDMWGWSKDQSSYGNLMNEWDRLGILPYGIPYVEFAMETLVPPQMDHLELSVVPHTVLIGDSVTATVTAKDQYNNTFTDYDGTVHFETNRSAGDANLPADYTFVPGTDDGVHSFQLDFAAGGYFTLYCNDTVDDYTVNQTGIFVMSSAPVIDHFVVSEIKNMGTGELSNVRVRAIDDYGNVFTTYNGSVTFTTDAPAGTFTLPADYEFVPGDLGTKLFLNGVSFTQAGTYSVTVTDVINTTATGTQSGIVIDVRAPEHSYVMYDLFRQPFDDVWWYRYNDYGQDYVVANSTGGYAWLYDPVPDFYHGIIFAPYRWNTTATNMSTLTVDDPVLMPILGTPGVAGAMAHMDIYFTYINSSWWNGYWVPTWGSTPEWTSTGMDTNWGQNDGYLIGTVIEVEMNREAASIWLNMPESEADPAAWWTSNKASVTSSWKTWIGNQANDVYDIFCGYDDMYYDLGAILDLQVLPDGNLTLTVAHHNWGYEVVMTRWLTHTDVCTHEPYWQDFTLSATMNSDYSDVTFDGVALYSLRAVKANESSVADAASAWAWEPSHIDYVPSSGTHPSEFDPWGKPTNNPKMYMSWNAGDPSFGINVPYDATPAFFNLTATETLTFKLPSGTSVLGFKGESPPAPYDQILLMATENNYDYYNGSRLYGEMELGYYLTDYPTNTADLDSMYDAGTKTLTIHGPQNFDQFRFPNGVWYHGAPWIEFNVTPTLTASAVDAGTVEQTVAATSESIVSELAYLAAVFACVSALICVMALGTRRRY